ncbi:MAG: branched-chain amino acid ABC transporter permease [Christensenellales bacterium]|jgi:branched-chain amino acid transport system permease protein
MNKLKNYRNYLLFVIACVAFIVFVPQIVPNPYYLTVMNSAIIYFVAILGLTIVLGMGGQVTFSIAGTLGIGAFATGVATVHYGLHPLMGILISVVVTALFSWIIGIALFRLKGTYFAFASIALVQIIYSVLQNWSFVGGADGVSRIPNMDLGFFVCSTREEYFIAFSVIAIVCGLLVEQIRRTSLGRALASIRDDEIAARCLGVNVYRTKIISLILAGAFSGLAGALLAFQSTNITSELFTFRQSQIFLVMGMLGGVGDTIGALIGAVVLTLLPEMMHVLQNYYKLIYGVGIIILMIFMPMGISGMIKSIQKSFARRKENAKRGAVK